MREHKYRAWHKKEKRMIEPVIQIYLGYMPYIGWYETEHDALEGNLTTAFLDEVELMDGTGLLDKNGKEIYEGDVVRQLEWGYIARSEIHDLDEFLRTEKVVSYEEDGDFISYCYESGRDVVTLERFRFWLKNESFGWEGEDLWNPEFCEIIGNIYDHPHLLKGDGNA